MRYVDLGKAVENHKMKRELERNKMKSEGSSRVKLVVVGVVALVLGVVLIFFGGDVAALFDPISIVSSIAGANLKETDGRTNVLILGSDKRSVGDVESVLTDTLLVASIGRVEKNVVMISLPRDLWVLAEGSEGKYHKKINAIYGDLYDGGAESIRSVVEDVLGLPIHYYAVVDFVLFRDMINILGGIEVDVERTFDDFNYPKEGEEASSCGRTPEEIMSLEGQPLIAIFPCRYEHVHFEAGKQVMDGDMALKFVRSRKGTNSEGNDFARAARQQKVIMALKDRVLSLKTLVDIPRLKELYELYSGNVDTDIYLDATQGFYFLSQNIDFNKIRTIVLDDRSAAGEGGLLYSPEDKSLYRDAYVLIPKVGDFSQIHAYVQRYVFGDL